MSIKRLLSKTGLSLSDSKYIGFSAAGIIAFIASFFTSCSKSDFKSSTTTVTQTQTYQVEVKNTTSTVNSIVNTPDDFKKKNCGPTPGYPCGTKYYTVSIKDFS